VREIQESLRDEGHDPGQADGAWGPETQQAVQSFQEEQQLEPTGSLTIATLQQLRGGAAQQEQSQEQPQERPAGTQQEQQPGRIDEQPGRVGEQPGTLDQQMDPQRRPGVGTRQEPGTTQTPAPGTMETPGGAQEQPGMGTQETPGTGTGQRQ
jgi:peptidoglycan hydrolase-like protein with peptidoglycan-binding domain